MSGGRASMNEERIKQAVLDTLAESVDARALARAVDAAGLAAPRHAAETAAAPPSRGTQKLLSRIVLGDILDDAILAARPDDRTFPLRLFFSELGSLLARDDGDAEITEQAFTLASGLNFYFRASMDDEARLRVGVETSRLFYSVARAASLDPELVAKAAPLVAALMTGQLERVRLESVDHMKVFDSSVHERATGSDPTGSRILRAASFLCRVSANQAVKAKAQVVT
jgi:hypothetical protein